MQYNPPFGAPVVAGGAPYVNGNPVTATQGSIPPAGAIEYDQREIINVIIAAGLTPSNNNLSQLLEAIELLGRIPYCQDVGGINEIAINPAPALTAYATPLIYAIRVAYANSLGVQISVSGLAPVNLLTSSLQAVQPNTLSPGGIIIVAFDGTQFQLVGGGAVASGGSSPAIIDLWHYGVDVSITANFVNVTTDNVGVAWSAGLPVAVKIANTNTSASNIELNGFANVNITRGNGGSLSPGDLVAGKIAVMVYDGVQAQLLNPQTGAASVFAGTDVGTPNALLVSAVTPSISAVLSGMLFNITKSATSNTGAATIDVLGTTAALTWADGTALQSGDWPASVPAIIQYTGTTFLILSIMGPTIFQRASQIALFKGTDTGTANAINVTSLVPAESSIVSGQVFEITKTSSANTGAATATIMSSNGALQWADGSALAVGDWPASTVALLSWNGTAFSILSVMGPTVFSRHTSGAPHNSQTFTSSGTFTPSASTYWVYVRLWGGGGGGGGTSGSNGGGGGGGGGYTEGWLAVTPSSPITVTIGAGGTAGPGNSSTAGTGGTSSFSSMSATGGVGGVGNSYLSPGGAAGVGSGGQFNQTANISAGCFNIAGEYCGGGGGSPFGVAMSLFTINTTGNAGNSPGGGGSGGGSNAGGGAFAGGAGQPGLCIVSWA